MNKDTREALFEFVLRHGDNALIHGHRLSELCSRGPFLEEDIATTNIALDLLGQSRILYAYASEVEGKARTEDDLAYHRMQDEFRNAILLEQPNGDFAFTTAKQLYYSAFAYLFQQQLKNSPDQTLAGYSAKAFKETTYHWRHCSEWVIRLGDGTEESRQRMQTAINDYWMYTNDLFATIPGDEHLFKEGIIPDINALKPHWTELISEILKRATLAMPDTAAWQQSGSRIGKHTEELSYILGEMQYLQRAYPGAEW
ncbi:MAG TPA: 1,2-phenylacetyl-CoA epoxidase subunit PaaC [Bacteroidia bacterium]|nr:1,2-phenylacetyl-CoA epoxidase subunit PaaC [Bacteroidia bacterium]